MRASFSFMVNVIVRRFRELDNVLFAADKRKHCGGKQEKIGEEERLFMGGVGYGGLTG